MGTPSWSTWTGLPGITTNVGVSAITSSIISGIEDTVVVAAADETNTVQINTYANGEWAGWTPVPGVQTSATPLLTQDSTGTTLSLYVAAVDEQVYVNSTTAGNNWAPTWTPVRGAKSKFGLSASPDWYLYLVGLSGHIWSNSNPPGDIWTKLVINGNAFRANASLYSGPPDADDKVWICNPGVTLWTPISGNGLTYVGIAGSQLFTYTVQGAVFFLTGRHNEIYFSHYTLSDSAPWKVIDGFKTNAALAPTAVNTLTDNGNLALCSVYLFGKGVDKGDIRYLVGQWTGE